MRTIKRLLIALLILLAVAALGFGGLMWYAQPEEELDLQYEEISVFAKAEEMIRSRQLSLSLTEGEVNHLLKQALSRQASLPADVELKGARFRLGQDQLMADVHLLYKGFLSAGATVYYDVVWSPPELSVLFDRITVKRLPVPPAFEPESFRINLEELLPAVIDVSDVEVGPQEVRFDFAVNPEQMEDLLRQLQQKFQGMQ